MTEKMQIEILEWGNFPCIDYPYYFQEKFLLSLETDFEEHSDVIRNFFDRLYIG